MATFLMLDNEEVENITFGLQQSLKQHRQEMAGVMRVRLQIAASGESQPANFKHTRFNSLIVRTNRLEKAIKRFDEASNSQDPPTAD